ncbi:uncharacterized protein LOC127239797 [Andrographis paniculata]|uniref:uncharacterized protein LOC127239797 n=1 Tax=Andrographis paniculata TaxID=175694 RepID=UPI0021E98E9C|nr:uncharacterized protein LOC127239797 [Andrographis paniculata]
MTVLRSREVLPSVAAKASPETEVFEPVTPLKTVELLIQPLNSCGTPSSSFGVEKYGDREIELGSSGGSVMVGESGIKRRCSLRLASKVGVNGCLGSVRVMSGRKKRKVEGSSLNAEIDVGNSRGGRSNSLKSDGRGEKIESATDMEGSIKLGSNDCMMKPIDLGAVNELHKKKSSEFDSNEEAVVEKGFLSLRSGKRVEKFERKEQISDGHGMEDINNGKNPSPDMMRGDIFDSSSESESSMEESEDKKIGILKISLDNPTIGSTSSLKTTDLKDKGKGVVAETGVQTRRRLSREEKGKTKLAATPISMSNNTAEHMVKEHSGSGSSSGPLRSAAIEPVQNGLHARETTVAANDERTAYREQFRRIARRSASRFAHFSFHQELGDYTPHRRGASVAKAEDNIEDWPGPFSTAMRIIRGRETNKRRNSSSDKTEAVELKWVPKKQEFHKHSKQPPSLQDLCLPILSQNADAISSLDFVPDVLRHKMCWSLCDSRSMDGHFLKLLVQGSPTEIRIRDCSWLSEDLFTATFEGCDMSKLTVLQFDQCGSCMPDYALYSTLACSPNTLPCLTKISLKAAYRFSDAGLSMLVTSAPFLESVDVSQCPLLTAEGICHLASSQRSILRELYLDECQGVDAMLILPALLDLQKLEVLSMAGIQTVCDDFVVTFVSAHGCRIKELGLANCMELTDESLKVIGENCSELRAIDLANLKKLTDVSIGHLANGCKAIQTLKLCRNGFSDEAIAAYLDLRGACLNDLILNSITEVSNHTALSVARNCRNLRSLDLSWCRNLTNEAFGVIVDSCSSLELLKLFGCTLVSNVFLDGHSNPRVKIIGTKMTAVLTHIDVPNFFAGRLRD